MAEKTIRLDLRKRPTYSVTYLYMAPHSWAALVSQKRILSQSPALSYPNISLVKRKQGFGN